MKNKYQLNQRIQFKRSYSNDGEVLISVRDGSERQELSTSDINFIIFLLGSNTSYFLADLEGIASSKLELTSEEASSLIQELIEIGIFNIEGQEEITNNEKTWENWNWRDAYDFHFATRNMVWRHSYKSGKEKPPIMTYIHGDQLISPDRPKPVSKEIPDSWQKIHLQTPSEILKSINYAEVLNNRRTTRHFSGKSIPVAQLTDFLNFCNRPILLQKARPFRITPTYSLGDFFSTYVLINHVDGIEKGIYYYNYIDNTLNRIKSGISDQQIKNYVYNQPFVTGCAFAVVFSVNWESYMWKYRFSRTYRLALFEMSSLVQTSLLIGTSLNLQTFLTPAIDELLLASDLGIKDVLEECPLYFVGLGVEENLSNISQHDQRNYAI